MSITTRSGRSLRRVVSLSAAGAMVMAFLPAGAAAQEADARSTNPPCDGDYDSTFDDIAGSEHENEVLCMADLGLTEGTNASDGESYAPRRDVTRAQMASFIARFIESYNDEELEEGDEDRFDDVDSSFEHAENINKLANIDLVEGTNRSGGDEFDPQSGVTRAQMGSFIRRALSFLDNESVNPLSEPPDSDEGFFDDVGSESVHYENVNSIAAVGIVQGFDDGDYRPANNVFRDQMASFVMRAFNYAIVENLGADTTATFDDVELSWFDEVSTEAGEDPDDLPQFGDDDVFATGDALEDGQNGADGSADITVDSEDNTVTFTVEYSEVEGPFGEGPGLHIHEGDRDENGPVVVLLDDGSGLDANAEAGVITGTVTVDADDFDVQEIIDDPEDYYVNLHSEDFPAGAIRGQLPDGPPSIAEDDVTSEWSVEADPAQAMAADPDGGEEGAQATFDLTFDSDANVVCYEITSDGVSGGYESPAHTSTHIHQGDAGEVGPPRVLFRNPVATDSDDPDGERTSSGCHSLPQETNTAGEDDVDNGVGFDLAEIEENPTNFYVDIHTEEFVPGAVRGQFELLDTP